MQAPWHIRAWAVGASLVINGALVAGALHMRAEGPMPQREETGMLVSLGDPALISRENAAAPDAASKPSKRVLSPAPQPVVPSEQPPQKPPRPDGYVATSVKAAPLGRSGPPLEQARPAPDAAAAATTTAAKAMAATTAPPPTGRADADSLQAHPGSSSSYGARVRAWLESHKTYPKAARIRRQQGVARVVFVLDRSGHVLDCRLVDPSGHALLDQEALAMVARADPFPAPPHTIKGARIELDAPVEFALGR